MRRSRGRVSARPGAGVGEGTWAGSCATVVLPGGDEAWQGETGYVHDALEHLLPAALAHFEFYFAGPPPMTQALQELLMVGHQVPFQQIHFDRFF